MSIALDGSGLTIEKLVRIARHNEPVELPPDALERIKVCRAMLEEKIQAREIMYGVNTGIGEFSEIVLSDDQVKMSLSDPNSSALLEESDGGDSLYVVMPMRL